MFDSFPFLHGKHLDYKGYFTLLAFLVMLGLGLLTIIISYILKIVAQNTEDDRQILRGYAPAQNLIQETDERRQVNLQLIQNRDGKDERLIKISVFVNKVGWFFLSMLPVTLSMFRTLLPTWGAIIGQFLILHFRLNLD